MLGWQEVILIFALLFIVFGPTKLPKIARELGKAMREFNKATSGLKEDILSSSTVTSRARARKWKRDKALSDIAKKLNITSEGKTNEQIAQEIMMKIESEKEMPSNIKTRKR